MAKASASTAVEAIKSNGVVPAQLTLEMAIAEMMAEPITAEEIAAQVLAFDSIDDILGDSTVVKLDDIIGETFTIERVQLHRSDYADGLGAYAVMFGTKNGDPVIITSGASQVVAQCIAMHRQGFLPYTVSSRKADKATANGYYPVKLCKSEEGF